MVEGEKGSRKLKRKGALYALKSMIVKLSGSDSRPVGQYRKFVEKVDEVFFSVSSSLIPFHLLYFLSTEFRASAKR